MKTTLTVKNTLLIYQFTVKKLFENRLLMSLSLIGIMTLCSFSLYGQRYMENLDRGLIAMRTGTSSVLISWRIPGDEYAQNTTYNLYRGSTLIASNLSVSNYVDATSTDHSYSVAAVIGGTEQALSAATGIRGSGYFTIPVRSINGGYTTHNLNDASVGDLDGDGEYEIVIKRLSNDESPSSLYNHYLEAYELDGTFMWAIDLGPNLLHAVEVNFLVYDFDNDGKAEIATRTSDGMIDGLGNDIGDRDGDGQISYRSTAAQNGPFWFRTEGPDYISIFNGETGAEIAWDNYISLEPIAQWGLPGQNLAQLGHRATKCMWTVAYTDGENPSFVIGRGIYERIKLEAWHFRNGTLTQEWAWDSDDVGTAFNGQGNHNLAAGDVDGDGRDEITYGGMAVDEYGNGLYSTSFGHGDAGHLADINPDIAGLEYFGCQEYANGTTIPGIAIRNAESGTIQWANWSSGDIGRCMAADVDPNYKGMEIWGSDGSGLRSCTGQLISNAIPTTAGNGASYNFGVWWDGDVQREILDRTVITKWNGSGTDRVATLYNVAPISDNNSTKSNPCLMADILGDWREEVIYRRTDNTGLIVFVSPYSTTQRMYTLMHDPNYRTAIAWQNNSYNQPPNLGFYFGGGMNTPPSPNIKLVNAGEPLDIVQKEISEGINTYPNPSNGIFYINLPVSINNVNSELYNINGALISSQKHELNGKNFELDITDKPAGMYFLKINLTEPVTLKIIKTE
ncbi:T9SS type A sorting domain-containing protein [Mariniflexile sp. HMF6888]|uniref:rhamnogalacturonan lyase family protein n=1 Tax=Mariniflexile sp. HMF6888 TaxID=3373086 RepID=UPI0037924F5E